MANKRREQPFDAELLTYASEAAKPALEAWLRLGTSHAAAKSLGMSQSTVSWHLTKTKQAAKAAGYHPVASKGTDGKEEWKESKTQGEWSFDGTSQAIQTLDDALAFSKVDLTVWEVDRHVFNKWPTTMSDGNGGFLQVANIQVKIWFVKRIDHDVDWDKAMKQVHAATRQRAPKIAKGSGIGVAAASDFHFGAYVDDLLRSDKFSIDILVGYMKQVAASINARKRDEVHLFLLGDFIESFTGLNHRNSWKGLAKGQFGINATTLCFELLMESLLVPINNLTSVSIVSGNHDRVTSDKELDPKGEVAELLAYMIRRELTRVEVNFNPLVLNQVVDGISYILTHGHHGFAKRELSKIILDHGQQGMFNVLVQGHLHSRSVTKAYTKNQFKVDEVETVSLDEVDSRRVVVPPLFTGNFYSEALGFSSSAGFNWFENNGKGRIRFVDECL